MMFNDPGKLFISMYHYTRDLKHSRYPGIKGLDIRLFRQQMEFFKTNCNVVTMEQVIDAAKGNSMLPENAVLLTFDDGYIDNFTCAYPILEEFGFQGSFFIPGKTFTTHQLLDVNKIHYIIASADIGKLVTDVKQKMDYYRGREFDYPDTEELWNQYAVDERFDGKETIFVKRILQTVLPEMVRKQIADDLFDKYVGVTQEQLAYELYMTPEQIRTLKKNGMFIGLHGYDHYWLGNLPHEQMKEDILKALDTIEEFIDPKEWVMNYPYGDYSDEVVEFIKDKGAVIGLTTDVAVARIGMDSNFLLPRLDCNDFPPKSDNYKKWI
jgi:peptidoglycan/xylan/chitin deacetylase (PgdA/CDA1 family)